MVTEYQETEAPSYLNGSKFRWDIHYSQAGEDITSFLPPGVLVLPNTSGAETAEEAVRTARLARAGDALGIDALARQRVREARLARAALLGALVVGMGRGDAAERGAGMSAVPGRPSQARTTVRSTEVTQ